MMLFYDGTHGYNNSLHNGIPDYKRYLYMLIPWHGIREVRRLDRSKARLVRKAYQHVQYLYGINLGRYVLFVGIWVGLAYCPLVPCFSWIYLCDESVFKQMNLYWKLAFISVFVCVPIIVFLAWIIGGMNYNMLTGLLIIVGMILFIRFPLTWIMNKAMEE